jgi:hypothetical protein
LSPPQIEFYSGGGQGRNTAAEEILVFGPDRAIEQQGSGDDHSFASRGEIRSQASPANGFIQTKADRLIQLEEFLERQKTGGGIKVAPPRQIGNVAPRVAKTDLRGIEGDCAFVGFAERAHSDPKYHVSGYWRPIRGVSVLLPPFLRGILNSLILYFSVVARVFTSFMAPYCSLACGAGSLEWLGYRPRKK